MNEREFKPLPDVMQDDFDDGSIVYLEDNKFCYNTKVNDKVVEDLKNKQFQVFTGYYIPPDGDRSPTIYLIGRGKKSGKKKIKIENFLPYCYIKDDKGEYKDYLGKKVKKVKFAYQSPAKVGIYRRKCEKSLQSVPYEADVKFVRRFLCDTGEFFSSDEEISPKIGVIDVETDYPKNPDKIISFAINGDDELYFNSIHRCSHHELIEDLINKIEEYDILTGWNVVDFDAKKIEKEIAKLFGKKKKYIKLYHYAATIDLMHLTRKMYGKQIKGSYSLENTGKEIVGIQKVEKEDKHPRDLPPEKLMEYNCMDVIIPSVINNQLGAVESHYMLAKSLNCKLEDTKYTAVVNDIAILKAYHKDKVVLPSKPPHYKRKEKKKSDDYDYKAADIVARAGVYEDVAAGDLDAAYPTSVVACNISCETKDPNGKYKAPNDIRFNDGYSTFISELKHLMKQRSKVKEKLHKLPKGSNKWEKYKYMDFGLKTQVAAFSHGIFGWASSRMYDPEVAGAITSVARKIIDLLKEYTDKQGTPWKYCHSVVGDTPILVKENGKINVESIREIYESDISNKYVWSDNGWSKIKKAIRHKRYSNIHRIITRQGLVDVTDCHSLLDLNGNEVIPKDIKIGDKLLHKKFDSITSADKHIDDNLAWLFGLFMAEGSSAKYNTKWGSKYTWYISNEDKSLLNKAGKILVEYFDVEYEILDVRKSTGCYRLQSRRTETNKQNISTLYKIFRPMFYTKDSLKKVPKEVLNSNHQAMKLFLDGYNCGDGSHNKRYKDRYLKFTGKSKVEMLGLVYLLEQLGYDYCLNDKSNGTSRNYYSIQITSKNKENSAGDHFLLENKAVKKNIKIDSNDKHVYDLETENHHFHAGIGNIIVHNTDSIYFLIEKENVDNTIDYLNKEIEKYADDQGWKCAPALDYEGYFKKVYIHSPARNVLVPEDGSIEDVDSWKPTGMNYIRAEVPEPLKDIEIECIKDLLKGLDKDKRIEHLKQMVKELGDKDSRDLGIIKPLNKKISKYGRKKKDGTLGYIPYHIQALIKAKEDYGFDVEIGQKFLVIPIITDKTYGKRKVRRERVFMAYPEKYGLPEQYDIDYVYYLRSNLWGKICNLFDMEASDLELKIMTEDVLKYLNMYEEEKKYDNKLVDGD